jgi:hypothetical protein
MKRGINQNGFSKNCSGQIWIETVIYTAIAFVMIGLVLAYAKPKIEEMQDRAIIDQSIEMLEEINRVILDIGITEGNKRIIELSIKKGVLKINGATDEIIFEIESACEYSENDTNINIGNVIVRTEKKDELNLVTLTKDYSEKYNIVYDGGEISKSPTPYKLIISNNGADGINIDIN